MHILLCVHHHLDANTGAPGVTLQLAEAYRALGHEVSLLSFEDLPRASRAPVSELIFPEAVALLLSRRTAGVDVIDATTGDLWLWARLDRRRRRPKLVTRSHGLEHVFWKSAVEEAQAGGDSLALRTRWYHGGWRLKEVASSLRASDACVFCNATDLEFAVRNLRVERSRAAVVQNGIPESLLALALQPTAGSVTVAVMGTWAPRKGVRYAAAALASILARHPSARGLFLGTRCPPEEVVMSFDPSVRDRLKVVPSYERPELPELLRDAQVLLSASLAEGFSLALPEAMAVGLAPVATDLPGTREIVQDGKDGLLVPLRDAPALAQAVGQLIDDPPLLHRLRTAAQAKAQSFAWQEIARRNLDVYDRTLRQ